MITFTMTHPTNDENSELFDQQITVTGTFYGGCAGTKGSYGEPLTPDDDPEFEVTTVEDEAGKEIITSYEEDIKINDYFWDNYRSIMDDNSEF